MVLLNAKQNIAVTFTLGELGGGKKIITLSFKERIIWQKRHLKSCFCLGEEVQLCVNKVSLQGTWQAAMLKVFQPIIEQKS